MCLFDIVGVLCPSEIVPGTPLTLNATIIDPSTNQRWQGNGDLITLRFLSNSSDGTVSQIGDNITQSNPVFTTNGLTYPNDGKAYAYMAKIISGTMDDVPQGVVGNPLQLAVGMTTRLLLNVTRDHASSNHTIQGWLKYNSTSQGVGDRWISVKINETVYSLKTDGSGHFVKSVGLQPLNNTATLFVISASFNGDQARTATISAKTLEGVDYPACTTIQYNDYKPSANSASVIIEPQASQVTQQTKTSEQLQQETEQGGQLQIWPEFSWSYPWFRLHVKITLNPTIHIGFNPILPDDGICETSQDLWEFFMGAVEDFAVGFVKMVVPRALSYIMERPAPDNVAWGLAFLFFGINLGLMYFDWNSRYALLGGAMASLLVLIGTATRRLAPLVQSMTSYIFGNPVLRTVIGGILQFVNSLLGLVQNFVRRTVDVIEVALGAVLTAIAVGRAMQL